MKKNTNWKEKHQLFLNIYSNRNFSRCPKCTNTTKQKKFTLVILFDNDQKILWLNGYCKYCRFCDLIIAKKTKIEEILESTYHFEAKKQDFIILGTLPNNLWSRGVKKKINTSSLIDEIILFKKMFNFKFNKQKSTPNIVNLEEL